MKIKESSKIALVIPTIREDQILEFLASWREQLIEVSARVYVVEDNPTKSFAIKLDGAMNIEHLTWKDAPEGMLDCINVKSPGCRQIGFWKAYNDGCDVMITLDDDVRPAEGPNFFKQYYDILMNGTALWVDPLLNYRSRGYPEKKIGQVPIAFHVGSFLTVPDVDGETQLRYEKEFKKNPPQYIPRTTVVPKGQLIPVNGGICGWKRELTPYVHYTLWCKELSYRRFDDIWMGIILKRIMDHCGLSMSYGPPFVNHVRASNAEKNAQYEIEGKKWNEQFWAIFDQRLSKALDPEEKTLDETYENIALCLQQMDNLWAQREGAAMLQWRRFFKS